MAQEPKVHKASRSIYTACGLLVTVAIKTTNSWAKVTCLGYERVHQRRQRKIGTRPPGMGGHSYG